MDGNKFPKLSNNKRQHQSLGMNRHIFSDEDWGVQSPPKRIVFGFHYHFQKVSQDPLGIYHATKS